MKREITALEETDSFEEVPLPEDANLIGSRWVYTVKPNHPSSDPYKARCVAKGFGQVAEEDYLDTFAPTARPTTIRATVQDSWNKNYIIEQLDFETAMETKDNTI